MVCQNGPIAGGVEQAVREFALGDVRKIARLPNANAPVYRVDTDLGAFLFKGDMQEAEPLVELQARVADHLNSADIRQAGVMRTGDGEIVSASGFAAYEFLQGDAVEKPNDDQFRSHVHLLVQYHRALSSIDFPLTQTSSDLQLSEIWRRASSIDYILDGIDIDRGSLQLDTSIHAAARCAQDVLSQYRGALAHLPKQLIHADIGPGNILYDGQNPVSIIDFTPAIESPVYALCVSLFWHCVFDATDDEARKRIAWAASTFDNGWPCTPTERRSFFALMLRSAAYRLFARLIARQLYGVESNGEAAAFSPNSARRMANCVHRIYGWRGFLEGCM
jgi:Ser/Thr protein kinase RdoA (MazF antagonist)